MAHDHAHSPYNCGNCTLARVDPDTNYEGSKDAAGKRHGIGKCRFSDGSSYEGDWAENVRHGNGVFKTAGEKCIMFEG